MLPLFLDHTLHFPLLSVWDNWSLETHATLLYNHIVLQLETYSLKTVSFKTIFIMCLERVLFVFVLFCLEYQLKGKTSLFVLIPCRY